MRSNVVEGAAGARLPVFRSRVQGEVLARLLLGPEREFSMLELAVLVRSDLAAVGREVERLAASGVVRVREVAGGRVVARNVATPLHEPLARLLLLTFGPGAVVAEECAHFAGVTRVFLFGRWADRYQGFPGPLPGEVHVLIVGDVPVAEAHLAAETASGRLGLPVQAVVRTRDQWHSGTDPFLREIRTGRLVPVDVRRPSPVRADRFGG